MTTHDRDKVIAAAKEAGISKTWTSYEWYIVFERFYAIAFEDGRQAEREDCNQDTERYHWLRDQNAMLEDKTFYVGVEDKNGDLDDINWIGSDLDAAIDAAIRAIGDTK